MTLLYGDFTNTVLRHFDVNISEFFDVGILDFSIWSSTKFLTQQIYGLIDIMP